MFDERLVVIGVDLSKETVSNIMKSLQTTTSRNKYTKCFMSPYSNTYIAGGPKQTVTIAIEKEFSALSSLPIGKGRLRGVIEYLCLGTEFEKQTDVRIQL